MRSRRTGHLSPMEAGRAKGEAVGGVDVPRATSIIGQAAAPLKAEGRAVLGPAPGKSTFDVAREIHRFRDKLPGGIDGQALINRVAIPGRPSAHRTGRRHRF